MRLKRHVGFGRLSAQSEHVVLLQKNLSAVGVVASKSGKEHWLREHVASWAGEIPCIRRDWPSGEIHRPLSETQRLRKFVLGMKNCFGCLPGTCAWRFVLTSVGAKDIFQLRTSSFDLRSKSTAPETTVPLGNVVVDTSVEETALFPEHCSLKGNLHCTLLPGSSYLMDSLVE